jgi:thioredoxin
MRNFFTATLAISFLFLFSCNNSNNQKTDNNSKLKTEKGKKDKLSETDENTHAAIHLTKADFLEKVWDYEASSDKWEYKGDKPCIIDFYADWCGPCKIAGPILEELAQEYKGQIYVYKINTEKEQELAAAFGIKSIPTFLYCPVGKNPQMAAGIGQTREQTKEMFKKVIDEFLLNNTASK